MRRRIVVVASVLVTAIVGLAVAQGSTRWIQQVKSDVRAGRGSFYEVVDTVLKGDQVQLLATDARWSQVRTARGRQGWLYEAALAGSAVGPAQPDFLKLAPGDASTSATAASAGAKGIYAQGYARERGFDYGAVTYVESSQPGAADIEAFVREGGLELPGAGR